MKKTYFAPEIKVVNIPAQKILAGSDVAIDKETDLDSVEESNIEWN